MLKNKKYGFTIIEVVLVLAIAGLIFLMVFIALPALQRSQRNAGYKNNLSLVASAVQQYKSNNRGNLPPDSITVDTNNIRDAPNHPFYRYVSDLPDGIQVKVITTTSGYTFKTGDGRVAGRIFVAKDVWCDTPSGNFYGFRLDPAPGKVVVLTLLENSAD